MLLTPKFRLMLYLFLHTSYAYGICPCQKSFITSSYNNDIRNVFSRYMSSPTSYDVDCHRFVKQPPVITDEVIRHALMNAAERSEEYALIDNKVLGTSLSGLSNFWLEMERNNFYFESATKYVQETTCASKTTTTVHLPTHNLERFSDQLSENVTKIMCSRGNKSLNCSNRKRYRQQDGTCNNLMRPFDGTVGDCMRRLLPPDYKDGVSQMRTSIDGSPLPNSRLLSTNLLGQEDRRPLSSRFTEFHAFFGELVIIDTGMTFNPNNVFPNKFHCCDGDGQKRSYHPKCAAIFVPPNDDLFHKLHPQQKCMHFVRSFPCARCAMGSRMISNSATAALDLNAVYGLSTSMLNDRRTMIDGCLMSQTLHGGEVFATERLKDGLRYRCLNNKCQLSYKDGRNNLFPTGLIWILIFHRNHNRHARILKVMNPNWSDEIIFQEARKWNIAEYQHCLYNEYFTTLIGTELSKYFGILSEPLGKFTKYNPNVQLNTMIEYQSTAGRSGHNMLNEDMFIRHPNNGSEFKISIGQKELFESIFENGYVSAMFFAQMSRPAFESTPSVPLKTFVGGLQVGLDLASLDIQRQRDHGIPGYVNYLKLLHNFHVHCWQDLRHFIDSNLIKKLKKHYKYVEDVELYIGAHYERKLDGALFGPTFAKIIGTQFHNSKFGDRFFYEHGGQINSFSLRQLNEIKSKSTLARLICKNTDLDQVLADPFRLMTDTNPFVSCSVFEDFDYSF